MIVPISDKIPKFKFPALLRGKIGKAFRTIVQPDHGQPLVCLQLIINRGAAGEPKPGLALFTSRMLLKGCKKMNAEEIATFIDFRGISISSAAQWDSCSIKLVGKSEFTEDMLGLMENILSAPDFNEAETNKLKKKTSADIMQSMSDPDYLANYAFVTSYFAGHNYGHPLSGTESSVASISSDDCRGYYEDNIIAGNATLIATGDIEADSLKHHCKGIAGLFAGKKATQEVAKFKGGNGGHYLIDNPGASQVCLRVGRPVVGRTHPDFVPLQFANTVFGGYFMSRLNYELREKKGYTYGIHSILETKKHAATLIISGSLEKNAIADALKTIDHEYAQMHSMEIEPEEMETARQYILGSFLRSMETPLQRTGHIGIIAANKLPDDYFDNVIRQISELTARELYNKTSQYFSTEGRHIAASGDVQSISKMLEEYSPKVIGNKS